MLGNNVSLCYSYCLYYNPKFIRLYRKLIIIFVIQLILHHIFFSHSSLKIKINRKMYRVNPYNIRLH
jgi:hypothetical protein